MNLFDCTLTVEGLDAFLDTSEFRLKIEQSLAAALKAKCPSTELIVGARPKDVTVSKGTANKDEVPAEIYVVEPVGESTIVDLKIGKYLAKARAPAGFRAEIGDKVALNIPREKMHIFDKKTERLLV
jgi:ABC-type sugar transport system ATPase subunit